MKRDLDPSDPLTVMLRRETFNKFRWAMLLWFVLSNTNSDEKRLRPLRSSNSYLKKGNITINVTLVCSSDTVSGKFLILLFLSYLLMLLLCFSAVTCLPNI